MIYGKCFVNHSFSGFAQNWICVFLSTESAVLIRSGYSFVAVEVKVWKYNKTLNVRFPGKPVSFVFPRVVLFPSTSCRDTSNMVTERVYSKLKTCWKSVVFTNKVGKNSRGFVGVFNKTIIPLAFAGYELVITNSALRASWLSTISCPKRTLEINVINYEGRGKCFQPPPSAPIITGWLHLPRLWLFRI